MVLEKGREHTAFGVQVAMIMVALTAHDIVRQTALHDVDPSHLGCALAHLHVVKQPVNNDKDLLQPAPLCAADELEVDAIQLRRVSEAVLVQHVLDCTRTASSPAVQSDVDLEHAVVALPFEDNERASHQLAVVGESEPSRII